MKKVTKIPLNLIFFVLGLLIAIGVESISFVFNEIRTINDFIFNTLENSGKSLSIFVKSKCDYEKFARSLENDEFL